MEGEGGGEREGGRDWVRVSWCFKPSQPQRIISGLKETFSYVYISMKSETITWLIRR